MQADLFRHPDVGWYMSGAANQVFVVFFVDYALHVCSVQAK